MIIVDPMGEYAPLVERLGGQVIEIAPASQPYQPHGHSDGHGRGRKPLSMKADFALLCELVVGGKEDCSPSRNRHRPLCAAHLPGHGPGDRGRQAALAPRFV